MILCFSPSPDNKRIYRIPSLSPGLVNRATEVVRWLSGKGVNAARAAACVGEDVHYAGFMGSDLQESAETVLRAAHVTPHLVFTEAHTRSCITVLEAETGEATELVEEAPPVSPLEAGALLALFRELLDALQPAAVTLSGSLPTGCHADYYMKAIAACREREIPVVLDCANEPLRLAAAAKPEYIKINVHELCATFPLHEGEFAFDAARALSTRTGGTVVITDGAKPVFFSTGGGECRAMTPPRIQPVNPIGSGDAFTGGIAVGLSRGDTVERAIRFGIALASANALSLEPGMVKMDDVEHLLGLL